MPHLHYAGRASIQSFAWPKTKGIFEGCALGFSSASVCSKHANSTCVQQSRPHVYSLFISATPASAMSTLPLQSEQVSGTLQLTPRGYRPGTYPGLERELRIHYRSTQLSLCNRYLCFWRPSLSSSISFRCFPGDVPQVPELYISLWCHCSEAPVTYSWVHFTVGSFMLHGRVDIGKLLFDLEQPLRDWQSEPLVAWLVPYGRRGFNRALSPGSWLFFILQGMRVRLAAETGLVASWLPDFHITWRQSL